MFSKNLSQTDHPKRGTNDSTYSNISKLTADLVVANEQDGRFDAPTTSTSHPPIRGVGDSSLSPILDMQIKNLKNDLDLKELEVKNLNYKIINQAEYFSNQITILQKELEEKNRELEEKNRELEKQNEERQRLVKEISTLREKNSQQVVDINRSQEQLTKAKSAVAAFAIFKGSNPQLKLEQRISQLGGDEIFVNTFRLIPLKEEKDFELNSLKEYRLQVNDPSETNGLSFIAIEATAQNDRKISFAVLGDGYWYDNDNQKTYELSFSHLKSNELLEKFSQIDNDDPERLEAFKILFRNIKKMTDRIILMAAYDTLQYLENDDNSTEIKYNILRYVEGAVKNQHLDAKSLGLIKFLEKFDHHCSQNEKAPAGLYKDKEYHLLELQNSLIDEETINHLKYFFELKKSDRSLLITQIIKPFYLHYADYITLINESRNIYNQSVVNDRENHVEPSLTVEGLQVEDDETEAGKSMPDNHLKINENSNNTHQNVTDVTGDLGSDNSHGRVPFTVMECGINSKADGSLFAPQTTPRSPNTSPMISGLSRNLQNGSAEGLVTRQGR